MKFLIMFPARIDGGGNKWVSTTLTSFVTILLLLTSRPCMAPVSSTPPSIRRPPARSRLGNLPLARKRPSCPRCLSEAREGPRRENSLCGLRDGGSQRRDHRAPRSGAPRGGGQFAFDKASRPDRDPGKHIEERAGRYANETAADDERDEADLRRAGEIGRPGELGIHAPAFEPSCNCGRSL